MKLRTMCKSKIHHAVVTEADLNYIGSIGIDESLMRMTGIIAGEQVSVWSVNNGQRPPAISAQVTASSSWPFA